MNGHKLSGKIIDPITNSELKSVKGDLINGVVDLSSNEKWIEPLAYTPIKPTTTPNVLNDKNFSPNVWKEVFKCMNQPNPDYQAADVEKEKVENAQRLLRNSTENAFQSRFGFGTGLDD